MRYFKSMDLEFKLLGLDYLEGGTFVLKCMGESIFNVLNKVS